MLLGPVPDVTGVKPAAPADVKVDLKKKQEDEARKRKRPEEDADEDLQSTGHGGAALLSTVPIKAHEYMQACINVCT